MNIIRCICLLELDDFYINYRILFESSELKEFEFVSFKLHSWSTIDIRYSWFRSSIMSNDLDQFDIKISSNWLDWSSNEEMRSTSSLSSWSYFFQTKYHGLKRSNSISNHVQSNRSIWRSSLNSSSLSCRECDHFNSFIIFSILTKLQSI